MTTPDTAPRSGPDAAVDASRRPWVLTVRGRASARQIPLREGTVTLGGSRSCGVVLDSEQVAGQHARLQVSAESALLSILPNAAPAVLHGIRVQRAGLSSGDSFRLGDLQLTLRRGGGEVAASALAPSSERQRPIADPPDAAAPSPTCLEPLLIWSQRGPTSERGSVLAALCRSLRASAGCVFSADSAGRMVVLAAWGDPLADLDAGELAQLVRRATGGDGTVALHSGNVQLAGIGGLPTGGVGLLVRGAMHAATGELLRLAVRLFAHDALREQAAAPRPPRAAAGGLRFPDGVVVGQSPPMRRLYALLESMAQSQLPALVLGETGVGKEHVARLIHDSSARRERPFVTINCAAIPAELLESELFGIGRGVATGVSERAGKFREAHGGTLFLDEVGELPLPLQAKLLRALEEKKVQPLGGPATDVDLRIVAASNTRLDSAAERGDFRLDLYYRLAGLIVEVAPLRERAEDVPLLFEHFLREAAAPPPRLLPRALSALVRHRWEGNVRELRHEATRVAAVVGAGGAIDLEDLSPRVAASFAGEDAAAAEGAPRDASLDAELRRLERSLIGDAVAAAGGNLSEAARALGVSRTRLYRHLAASARPRR